ncbi:MAG: hypothetical protein H6551_08465 [Chitinophagales bacterium]|nr:hypothetical protein [Chitinophagales bacterium]
MKNLIITLLIFGSYSCMAQNMNIVKLQSTVPPKDWSSKTPDICFDKDFLQKTSDELYDAGNPNYVLLDLMKDGYINSTYLNNYMVHLYADDIRKPGNVEIPDDVRKAYGEKWVAFVKSINEPIDKNSRYDLYYWDGISTEDITDPESQFRANVKYAQYSARLTKRGELRLLKEMVADGVANPNRKIDYMFNKEGFWVQGVSLNKELGEKYMQICREEFGYVHPNLTKHSFKSSVNFKREIADLEKQLATTK